jgi:hypothetical protein
VINGSVPVSFELSNAPTSDDDVHIAKYSSGSNINGDGEKKKTQENRLDIVPAGLV